MTTGDNVWWWFFPSPDWQTPRWCQGIVLTADDEMVYLVFGDPENGLGKRWIDIRDVVPRVDDNRPTAHGSHDRPVDAWPHNAKWNEILRPLNIR